MTDHHTARCPRCAQPIGERPALSRLHTHRTQPICTPCGTDEAHRDTTGLAPIPPTDWPLATPDH
ncbi:hypothetical protein OG321_42225 [Streptomyces sp. NBC_00424]|uniref:hypothetical protein n=1 Tax=Streptomyces sp. NBC_00424 TaxID=2903648 RepID=UPI0022508E47|nr:hypothetical protein [Streptomyces sp. NBC_00424]MCX5079015.1 hypothetical protein [Streptomyces sp. NBC_00424]